MIEPDTVKLLRECDAGIRMGISSIEEIYDHVKNEAFKRILDRCKDEHQTLKKDILTLWSDTMTTERNPTLWQKECRG